MKLTDLIPYWRRRTLSRYADDQGVGDSTEIAKDQGMNLDYDRTERLAELLSDDSTPDETRLAEIRKLLDD